MELQVESLEHCARANNFDFAAWEAERGLRTVFGLFQLFLAELSVPGYLIFNHFGIARCRARIHCPLPWQHCACRKNVRTFAAEGCGGQEAR
jgi:hypothetical protein